MNSREALVAPKSDTKDISKLRRGSKGVCISLASGSERRDAQGKAMRSGVARCGILRDGPY